MIQLSKFDMRYQKRNKFTSILTNPPFQQIYKAHIKRKIKSKTLP